jgi:hypothetical protein
MPNENEKNICQNPQLIEVEKKEERMIETIQTNNQEITKPYRTGSIISSRDVTMIKNVKLKLVRKSLSEVAEAVEKEEED